MCDQPTPIQASLLRLKAGEEGAREALFLAAQERLLTLVRNLMRRFPGLRRYEGSDDVLQRVLTRLVERLEALTFENTATFFGLVALNVRWQLRDLMRHYFGGDGPGVHCISATANDMEILEATSDVADQDDPDALARWTELHNAISDLPEDQRQVFEWHWYLGLTLGEIAEKLDVCSKTVERCWVRTKLRLGRIIGADFFE